MLEKSAKYFPIKNGRYEINVGAKKLENNHFGNGLQDGRIFQIDENFYDYLTLKKEVLSRHKDSCVGVYSYSDETEQVITEFLVNRFKEEYFKYFEVDVF